MSSSSADIARREAIDEYRILGEQVPVDLQEIVHVAAVVCDVPAAVINIIDDTDQHQIAAVGLDPVSCAREDSMCALVFCDPGCTVVSDARLDERFATNPFVTGEVAKVRFYASSPLVTPAGVPIGTLCVFDTRPGVLTPERKRALDALAHQVVEVLELRRISRELQTSNEQLERFAAQVSHDLRNPLTALVGFLELAADSPEMSSAPRAAAALARAEAAADRMGALVSDLLAYARVGGARPQRRLVPIDDLCTSIEEDLAALIEDTGARIRFEAGATVVGDPSLLRALLENLVSNALKFSRGADRTPEVVVGGEELAEGWLITVDDNGPGVPVAERSRVFALMERGTTQQQDGLGIGLSTCRRIVDAHGGRIGIEDSPRGGARFWVLLPKP
ncbi:GAF domain-containing sensor histidine kinase [uncultured Aeromicrobium sp.]|uniref:sensor histidine kinase n=1 Tax=uncultured Aeromicrobium sp. TaxID=337820 RepID=UPI0025FAE12A|nr:GAF domain-containing sensor histidine kinase [uncultured Aeromicrobium sp.]